MYMEETQLKQTNMKNELELTKELQTKVDIVTLRFRNDFDWNDRSEVLITFNMLSKLIQDLVKFQSEVGPGFYRFHDFSKITTELKPVLNNIERILFKN